VGLRDCVVLVGMVSVVVLMSEVGCLPAVDPANSLVSGCGVGWRSSASLESRLGLLVVASVVVCWDASCVDVAVERWYVSCICRVEMKCL
jgi:hypothetical protein